MSWREVSWGTLLWGGFLAGLPFAQFLLPYQLNQWQAQTLWAQAWLVLLFGLSIGGGVAGRENWPLGCWVAWIGLSVVWTWVTYLRLDRGHPVGLLPPFLHCLCVAAFYLAATRQWTPALLSSLLTCLAYMGLVLVGYGVLQLLGFDQFWRTIDTSPDLQGVDVVVGTMGNPSHFGNHLALLLPLFLWQPQWWWKAVAGLATVLMICTKSTSALVCGYAVWLLWSLWETRWGGWVMLGIGGLAVASGLLWFRDWLNPEGRLDAWQTFCRHYLIGDHKRQITGAGLGHVMLDAAQQYPDWPRTGSEKWGHVHNGFFHVLIEQGVIGVGLVCWGLLHAIRRWIQLPKTAVAKTLAGIGVAFLLSDLVSFPDHLWVLASLGLVAYCGVYVLPTNAEVV